MNFVQTRIVIIIIAVQPRRPWFYFIFSTFRLFVLFFRRRAIDNGQIYIGINFDYTIRRKSRLNALAPVGILI